VFGTVSDEHVLVSLEVDFNADSDSHSLCYLEFTTARIEPFWTRIETRSSTSFSCHCTHWFIARGLTPTLKPYVVSHDLRSTVSLWPRWCWRCFTFLSSLLSSQK
jgi:hypothetical protein